MPFVCKPRGGYQRGSADWKNNVDIIYAVLSAAGWSDYAVAGALGAFDMESGMNPWRWEGDNMRLNYGYGLPQFTPASDYINLQGVQGHAPNMSDTQISGGNVSDGYAQTYVVRDNAPLAKWTGLTWRSYWDSTTYPQAWAKCQEVRSRYGRNTFTYDFYQHNVLDIDDASYIFFSAYEGPGNANSFDAYEIASRYAYQYITGHEPPVPPTPTGRKLPLFFYLRYPF